MSLLNELEEAVTLLQARQEFVPMAIRLGAIARRTVTNEILGGREPRVGEILTHYLGVPIELVLDDPYHVSIAVTINHAIKAVPTLPFDERSLLPSDAL